MPSAFSPGEERAQLRAVAAASVSPPSMADSTASGASRLKGRRARGVVVGRRFGGKFHANARWQLSQPLNCLLRGSFGLVSVRFQDDPALYWTAVAFKNKPAPDDPVPAWIFSKPITIVALWLPHRSNMTCPVAKFQTGRSPTDSNGTSGPVTAPQFHELFLRAKPFWRLLAIAGRCTPSRRASITEPARSARPQHGAYPCILRVPRMRLTAGWTLQRNRHARKTLEQNPLAAQTR